MIKIKKLKNKNKNKNKGFTLIELLMAMVVFVSVVGGLIGIFIIGIKQQGALLQYQSALDQTSYIMEFMSRNLRLALKETLAPQPGACLSQNGLNFEIPPAYQSGSDDLGTAIIFINHLQSNDCQEFYLDPITQRIMYARFINEPWGPTTLPLTSSKIQVVSLKFNLVGKSEADTLQPLVTISAEIKVPAWLNGSRVIKIQTSISQRNLDYAP